MNEERIRYRILEQQKISFDSFIVINVKPKSRMKQCIYMHYKMSSYMKLKIGFLLLLTVLVLGCTQSSTQQTTTVQEKTYTSPDGYSISYPNDWNVAKAPDGISSMFVAPDVANVNVVIVNQTKKSLEITKSTAESVNSQLFPDFKFLSADETTINGKDAYRLTGAFTYNKVSMKNMQLYLFDKGQTYLLTYTAIESNYEKHISEFNRMAESFRTL